MSDSLVLQKFNNKKTGLETQLKAYKIVTSLCTKIKNKR